ncbi:MULTISPECIES: HTH domain-containing protein [unclassified Haladaptatus]|uniref:HTH domain-containing protein n=1 Tax=unclassified Haladaptatus TaxID=2622732 RepID=UPI0023E86EB6|nr:MULTISPECIES: HTH domain-containing protein [unclassified Haladaptatus]
MRDTTVSRVELFYRAHAPDVARVSQDLVIDRLDELDHAGAVRMEKHLWPNRIVLEDDHDESTTLALDSYVAFTQWAREHRVELAPYFHIHECHWFTGEDCTELVLPVMCLAAYDDRDHLVNVLPHTADGRHVSVVEFVASLEANAGRTTPPAV